MATLAGFDEDASYAGAPRTAQGTRAAMRAAVAIMVSVLISNPVKADAEHSLAAPSIEKVNCLQIGGGSIPNCDGSAMYFCVALRATVTLDTCTAATQRQSDESDRRARDDYARKKAALMQKQASGAPLDIDEQLRLKLDRPCPPGGLPMACTSARVELIDGVAGCRSLLGMATAISQWARMGMSRPLIEQHVPYDANVPVSLLSAVIGQALANARSIESPRAFGLRVEAYCLAKYGIKPN